MNHGELTVKEYAALERVAEKTVRRWIDKGAVVVRRTPGGGVRIQHQPSVAFIGTRVDKARHSSE